jgi:hypothetical protein
MTEAVKARGSHQPKNYCDQGGNREVFGGDVLFASGVTIKTEDGLGTKGTGVTVVEKIPQVHQTVLTVASTVTMTDATTNGNEGSAVLYTFPAGNILILGAVADLTLTAGSGGITDTAAVVSSLGSVAAAADATLTSTEANIIPSTTSTLTGGVGAMNGQSTAPVTLDGTATPAVCRLNLAVPDAGSSADDTIAAAGTVTLTWVNLGDN